MANLNISSAKANAREPQLDQGQNQKTVLDKLIRSNRKSLGTTYDEFVHTARDRQYIFNRERIDTYQNKSQTLTRHT